MCRMGNLFSGNMFSFDFRKTPASDYQRRPLRPWPTSPLRSMWAAITVVLGHRSIRCGPRLRHVGHDYGETKNAAHIRTESRLTSHRNQWPISNGITGPHRPEYATITRPSKNSSQNPSFSGLPARPFSRKTLFISRSKDSRLEPVINFIPLFAFG